MTATVSPGAFPGCLSKLCFWFWLSLAWLQICRNKKTMETKCTNSLEYKELLKSWSKKTDVKDEYFRLSVPGSSGQQLISWWYPCSSDRLKPWLLPNCQTKWLFFLCLPRSFIIPPQYNTFITHSFIQWALPGRQQWTGALALSLCFTVMSLCNFMEGTQPLWASISLFLSVDFGMWSQWSRKHACLFIFAYLDQAQGLTPIRYSDLFVE